MKVLVLLHPDLIPPDTFDTPKLLEQQPWATEFSVVQTLSKKLGHKVRVLGVGDDLRSLKQVMDEFSPHVVFNLLEEFAGEAVFDQNVVSYLELLGARYTGCNPRGLILSRDKALAKKILAYHRIPTPTFFVFRRLGRWRLPKRLPFPLFVKTLTEEASLGISQDSVVRDEKRLKERVEYLFDEFGTDVIAESYIDGREFYVSVMGNERTQVFPTWELFFDSPSERMERIYTRRAKWDFAYRRRHGISTGPAQDLPGELEKRIHNLCRRAYKALQLSGYARMDLRVTETGDVYLIEANPNPDIGQGEDFAESAAAAGIKYSDLLGRILRLAKAWSPIGRP